MALLTRARVLVAATFILTGCSALIGVNDIFLDDGAGEGGVGEGGFTGDRSEPSEGGFTDGGVCNADVQADPLNCARCGHSCLGGDCTNAVCQPTVVINGLNGPRDIAFDKTYVYVTSINDGTIKRIKKDDLDSGVETIISNWYELAYARVADVDGGDGGKLFFEGTSFAGDGAVPDASDPSAAFGGLWSCTLPACKDKKLIAATNVGRAVAVKEPYVYSVSEDDLRRVLIDGGDTQILNSTEGIYDVAVDDKNIYFYTFEGVQRLEMDGGGETLVGGGTGGQKAFIARMSVDSQRIYWAYYDSAAANKGYGASTLKATPGSKTFFGETNVQTLSITGDGTNTYWVNAGTDTDTQDGDFNMCPIAGCAAGVSSVVLGKLSFPNKVRVDTDAVYFTEFGSGGPSGRLFRMAKP